MSYDVLRVAWWMVTNGSEKPTASIFRLETEDGVRMFFRNVGSHL
jgi:hypothetical protein